MKTVKEIRDESKRSIIDNKKSRGKEINHNSINLDDRLTLKKTVIVDVKGVI